MAVRRENSRWLRRAAAAGLVLLGAAATFALDVPVYRFVDEHVRPIAVRDVPEQILDGLKGFSQIVPVLAIAWLTARLDRRRGRRIALRMIVAVLVAGMVCGIAKSFVGRQRPESFTGQTWRQTWLEWRLDLAREGKRESFFSGHTAAAFAMATVLGGVYPPVRPVVFTLAAGCGLSRVADEQHWLSDVYVGGAVGLAVGWLFLPSRRRQDEGEHGVRSAREPEEVEA